MLSLHHSASAAETKNAQSLENQALIAKKKLQAKMYISTNYLYKTLLYMHLDELLYY